MEGVVSNTVELPPVTEPYGLANFWAQGDAITHTVALILIVMSIMSWTQIAIKARRSMRNRKAADAIEKFWMAPSLNDAINELTRRDAASPFAALAHQAITASSHFDAHGNHTIGGSMDRSEFLTRAMRHSIVKSTAKQESGLTLLASIGSVSPFVGLFGTVWGIYHALIGIAAAGSASIDKVSGPVGEALIMTAAGLFVAIPAVLAYNAFTRMNRVQQAELDGFAHDLHAYLNTGARITAMPGKRAVMQAVEGGRK